MRGWRKHVVVHERGGLRESVLFVVMLIVMVVVMGDVLLLLLSPYDSGGMCECVLVRVLRWYNGSSCMLQ